MKHQYQNNSIDILTDDQFEQCFRSCRINPSEFNHEAHLRLAWIHISKYGIEQGIKNVCEQLLAYVKHVGAESKYNLTVTVAAIHAVHHFMRRSKSCCFSEFIIENPRLKFHFKDLMAAHYKTDIFSNAEAKKAYIEPELLSFD